MHVPTSEVQHYYINFVPKKGATQTEIYYSVKIYVCMVVWTLAQKSKLSFVHITFSLLFIPFETEQPIWTCSKMKGHHQTNGLYKCMIYIRVKTEQIMLKRRGRNSCTFFFFFFCPKLKERKNINIEHILMVVLDYCFAALARFFFLKIDVTKVHDYQINFWKEKHPLVKLNKFLPNIFAICSQSMTIDGLF